MILILVLTGFVFAFDNLKILIAVTNHADLGSTGEKTGYWVSEVAHPYHIFTAAHNWTVDFISPKGGPAPADPSSVAAAKSDPIAEAFLQNKRVQERLAMTLSPLQLSLPVNYDAIFYAGGHGTCWDFPEARALAEIASDIYRQGGVVSAVCHGPSGLFQIQDPFSRHLLISGRNVTGFSNAEEKAAGLQSVVPFSLQDTLVKLGASYSWAGEMWQSYVVVDGRLVTGENPQSSMATGEAVAKVLLKSRTLH